MKDFIHKRPNSEQDDYIKSAKRKLPNTQI